MKPSDKKFGISFAILFSGISIFLFIRNSNLIGTLFLLVAVFLFLFALLNSSKLSKINNVWYQFGILLAKILNPITLGILYFFLITPVALFSRIIFKRDLMEKNIENKETYWKKREIKIQSNSFYNQY